MMNVKRTLACLLIILLSLGGASALAADPMGKYDEPVTVNYARSAGLDKEFKEGQSYENNIWMTEYEEVLGIKINTVWTAEGVDAYNQRLNLSIASQDIPDIFACNASQFQALVEEDLIEDLTGVLAEYQSDLLKGNLAADGGNALAQCSVGGKVLALPQMSAGNGKHMFVYLREDWRKALDLPVPETMEDLVAIAKAFTENDPDGNGVKDIYGFAVGNQPFETWFAYKGWFNAYGAFPDQWVMKDGKVEHGNIQPEMKAALAAMKDAFDAGYIDPEFIVKDSNTVSQDAIAGRSGIFFGEWWLMSWPLPDAVKLGQDWKAYPIVFAASAPEQKVGVTAKLDTRYVVRKGFEHPEALVKMCNLFQERVVSMKYDTTIYKTDGVYDFQGLAPVYVVVGHDRNLRNHIVVTEALAKGDPSMLEDIDQENLYNKAKAYLETVDEIRAHVPFDSLERDVIDAFADRFWNYNAFIGPESVYGRIVFYDENGMLKQDVYTGADTPAMLDFNGLLKSNTAEMILNIISGAEPLDSFDSFVESWKALGGDEMTKEVNGWYATMMQ